MSILISPSNNTGWGLGVNKMYGGAKHRSNQHPVRVRGHYRAPWGAYSRNRRPAERTTVDDVIDSVVADARNYNSPAAASPSTVDAVIDSVVADARAYARQKRRSRRARRSLSRPTAAMQAARNLLRRARRTSRRALTRQIRAGRNRRRAAVQAAAAIARLATPQRGNVYWVRDASGVRVPVRTRPPRV
ncbi:core protein precursor pVII [Simian adenovirus DM-2014]|uniref:Pre-histone-like nucleoprotein n=1 Tax=Simian adenovirus DM-2014 TaxID=1560346 RepID=A0A097IWB3_9ADEN|nr:core protein precursor pVII [Simian adenovirus DM-2014]AIT70978.1 core protein precursor pVII [Simian adenovirus DM-2014]